MIEENNYLLKWSKIMLTIIVPLLILGIYVAVYTGKTSLVFLVLGLVLALFFVAFLENRIFSKLEKILGVKLKHDKSFSRFSYTYEGRSWEYLFAVLILAIVFYYPIAIGYHNLPAYVGFVFVSGYPLVVMILRRGTFSDSSIPSHSNPVYVGRNLVSGGPGYNPFHYFLFSLAIGGVSTVWGFSMFNFSDILLTQSLGTTMLGIIGQTIVLFPDKFNKISPVDNRTKKGLLFMTGVTIVIIILEQIFSSVLL